MFDSLQLQAIGVRVFDLASRVGFIRSFLALRAMFAHGARIRKTLEVAMRQATLISQLPRGASVCLVYDTGQEPGGLGNMLGFIFIARAMAGGRFRVRLHYVEREQSQLRAWTPAFLGNTDVQSRNSEMVQVAKAMSRTCGYEFTMTKSKLSPASIVGQIDEFVPFRENIAVGQPTYHHVLSLANCQSFVEAVGESSLSTADGGDLLNYVGWHVRFSRNNTARNPSQRQIVRDAKKLLANFPGAQIRVFSDAAGLKHVFETLRIDSGLKLAIQSEAIQPQRAQCFSDAVFEAMRCQFWFQRFGGGIGVVPLFSRTPFLVVSDDFYNWRELGGQSKRLFYWHGNDQRFVIRWRDAASFFEKPQSKNT